MAGIASSQEILTIDMLTALKPSLDHDRKYVLRLLSLHGDQALILFRPEGTPQRFLSITLRAFEIIL